MVVAAALLVAACAACTGGGSRSSTTSESARQSATIYLVRDAKVAPVRRMVTAGAADPVSATLDALTDVHLSETERSAGYESDVPSPPTTVGGGTGSVETVDRVARVALWPGPLPRLAQAQIVHTLTRLPGIERVAFVADGKVGPALAARDFEDETPQILVQSPLPGDSVRSPIRLRGTANVFEATVSIDVRDASGKLLKQVFTTATSGTGTRGTFDTEVALPRREGAVTVVAYEASAEDGRPLHVVEVPLELVR